MAHVTDLGFTVADLGHAVDSGEIRYQVHPEFPTLNIFNYTEETQYRNRWNKITLACRGLIVDTSTGEVVARPWEKFFNFGQMDNRIESTAPVEVTDKVDGSLGILYKNPDDEWAIATRGSFASEQAIHATRILNEEHLEFLVALDEYSEADSYTFLYEIVYPDNRIVVNYGDMDDLVMLGAVHKQYGYYLGPNDAAGMLDWNGPVTEVWQYNSFVDALSFPDRKGKEGVVIRSGRNIVKLKQADYVELHRIVTNLSPKTIWQMIGDGKTIGDICNDIPDEFHGYVKEIGEGLLKQASEIAYKVRTEFTKIVIVNYHGGETLSRKNFAEKSSKSEHQKYLFLLLDGKDIKPVIWQNIKPRGDVKSLVKDEG